MIKYDYLIIGSGLYGAVFAHEAKKQARVFLSSTSVRTLLVMCILKQLKAFTSTNTVHTFFIPITPRSGIISRSLRHSNLQNGNPETSHTIRSMMKKICFIC